MHRQAWSSRVTRFSDRRATLCYYCAAPQQAACLRVESHRGGARQTTDTRIENRMEDSFTQSRVLSFPPQSANLSSMPFPLVVDFVPASGGSINLCTWWGDLYSVPGHKSTLFSLIFSDFHFNLFFWFISFFPAFFFPPPPHRNRNVSIEVSSDGRLLIARHWINYTCDQTTKLPGTTGT